MEKITVDEFHERIKAQGVSSRDHVAFRCPMCGTVQSMASLVRAGATPEQAETLIGFFCEGRLTDAGQWVSKHNTSNKAKARRKVRGCNWTLGGLLKLHELEVITADGKAHPRFVLATPEQAREFEASRVAATTSADVPWAATTSADVP